jgi:hypothetical protein
MKIAILALAAVASAASVTVVPTFNPTIIPRLPAKCLLKGVVAYCIPNTFKYQVCSPSVKQVECPIDSSCKEYSDGKGNTMAYCKFIG